MLLALLSLLPTLPLSDEAFADHWHDGRAEVAGYAWSGVRYGEERSGQAVLVTVTEPFSESERVKADRPAADTFEALKLNFVRDFQTGIYDYNTMTSVFVRSADFEPVKVSFSSAEWCGHVYEELLFLQDNLEVKTESYFQGESGSALLKRRTGDFTEDELYIAVRGLRGPFLERGQSRDIRLLASSFERRLRHAAAKWIGAKIERLDQEAQRLTTPAGQFRVDTFQVTVANGRRGQVDVEAEYPHRVVQWKWLDPGGTVTDAGLLTGSERTDYWNHHSNGDESRLSALGLTSLGGKD